MSDSVYYSKEYKCDCGENYGDCEKLCMFKLVFQGSTDHVICYHKHGNSSWEREWTLSDHAYNTFSDFIKKH